MTISISGASAPRLFRESLYKMRIYGLEEGSRNGPVFTFHEPVILNLWHPWKRVLTDPVRNANPFFHVMEFVWMMAGSNDAHWIAEFNKNMMSYSDDYETIRGAYGHRWRQHFGLDQIDIVIGMLTANKRDRRAVLAMWDPVVDVGSNSKDVPCNTQIFLRVIHNHLDMTVINRSNDLIWGALGANVVHMTFLQELIANALGLPLGEYRVFTNNLHIYKSVPNFEYFDGARMDERDIYGGEAKVHVPLLAEGETYYDFVRDCERFVEGKAEAVKTHWMRNVAMGVYKAWGSRSDSDLQEIEDDAWRIACTEWVGRKRTPMGDKSVHDDSGLVSGQQASTRVDSGIVQSESLVSVDPNQSHLGNAPTESGVNGDVSP